MRLAQSKKIFTTKDVLVFSKQQFSRQYIQRIINRLVKREKLVQSGSTKGTRYSLKKNAAGLEMVFREIYTNKNLNEHMVWGEIKEKMTFMQGLPENLINIIFYAFSEMLNNAIDHSQSKKIQITVENKKDSVSFIVMDFGIGVFQNIMDKRPDLRNPEEIIQELLKGKLTTDPEHHTGEGIFFTSKICDSFILNSKGYQLKDDKETGDYGAFRIADVKKGTTVFCEISKSRKDSLNAIFTRYYTDSQELDFDKTEVKIKLYTIGRACISRSQARRVLSGLEKFKKVILDFGNVGTVGQAFVDEVFRRFAGQYPGVEMEPINMNKSVKFMVDRGRKK